MKRCLSLFFLACMLVAFGCDQVFAQATATSSIRGTIVDQSGGVVVGAEVNLTNRETGATRSTKTSDVGSYRFDLIPPGKYGIKVLMAGFATATAGGIEIHVGETSTIDVTLKPGSVTEVITITEQSPVLDVERTQVGLTITPREVENLPLNARDFGNLAYLAPGARPVDSYDPTKNRVAVFGINGSSGRNVNVTVNGIDNKDNTVGGPVMQFPLGAIAEFNISTQRFSAANGRSEGAAVNVITKSGANKFHGALYFFDTETALNANDFFSKKGGQPTPEFSRQQFGGSIGGPIRRDKDFFFFALERQREHTAIPVNPSALAELNLVTSLGAQPATAIPTPYFDWRYTARLDHQFNSSNSAFFTYSSQSNRGLNDQSGSLNDLTAGNFTTNQLILSNFTLNTLLTPRMVNSFTAGYQYWNNVIDTTNKVPTFTFPGGITFGTNTNVPQESIQKKWQFRDDLSIGMGNHSFKMGVDYLWEPQLGGFFEFNPTLEIDFFDKPSVILSNTTLYPNGFATPGAVSGMSNTAGDPNFDLPGGAKMLGLYFQDDWKARRNLTLNLGIRWDKDFNLIGTRAAPLNRTYLQLKAINSPFAASLPHDDNKDFSPRVGIAWDVTGSGKHLVRAGYGLYYGQTFLNIPLFMIQQIHATIFATTFSISGNGPGSTCGSCDVPGTGIPLSNWRFGVDPMPTNPPPPTSLQDGFTGRLMDPSYHNPYSQQFNAGYSYAFDDWNVIEVEYIHELGLRESKTININPVRVSLGGARDLDAAFTAAGLPLLGRIDNEESIGRSRYDGLNISYRRRMYKHFSINTNYVLSRGVAYNGNAAAFRNRPTNPDDPFNPADFGPVPNDERHRWVFSGVADLPWGFQIAPIIQLASARPYTGIQGRDVLGIGGGRGNYHIVVNNSDPTNLTANATASVATLQACLAANSCHQIAFDALRGQTFFQFDLRVSKNFRLGDWGGLRLISQFFDLTNRANFGNNFDGNVRNSVPTVNTFQTPLGFITPSGVVVPKSFRAEFGAEFRF